MKERRTFSKEFKLEAVRLLDNSNKPATTIARELGIPRTRLYKWKEQLEQQGDSAFPGKGRRTEIADEVARLKRELARLEEENAILKKAAAYFAREVR